MSEQSYYCLSIQVSGSAWSAYGTEQILRSAIDEWTEWCANPASENDTLLTIHGLTNTIDRSECVMVFKMEDVQAMSICRYS